MDDAMEPSIPLPIDLTAELVAAYVSHNHVQAAELPRLIGVAHAALTGLGRGERPAPPVAVEQPTPAQIRHSITHAALISFEDGRSYKTLKRHLTTRGLSPERYRAKWGLPNDYPMVCPSYSEQRSNLAKASGLGVPGGRVARAEPEADAPAQGRGRKAARAGGP